MLQTEPSAADPWFASPEHHRPLPDELTVQVPPLGPARRGRLAAGIEGAIERALESLGAAPPGVGASADLDASLSDQLYRARAVGRTSLALLLPPLDGIANLAGALDAEDSAVLRWWLAAAEERPLRIRFHPESRGLLVYGPPRALAELVTGAPGSEGGRPGAPEEAPAVTPALRESVAAASLTAEAFDDDAEWRSAPPQGAEVASLGPEAFDRALAGVDPTGLLLSMPPRSSSPGSGFRPRALAPLLAPPPRRRAAEEDTHSDPLEGSTGGDAPAAPGQAGATAPASLDATAPEPAAAATDPAGREATMPPERSDAAADHQVAVAAGADLDEFDAVAAASDAAVEPEDVGPGSEETHGSGAAKPGGVGARVAQERTRVEADEAVEVASGERSGVLDQPSEVSLGSPGRSTAEQGAAPRVPERGEAERQAPEHAHRGEGRGSPHRAPLAPRATEEWGRWARELEAAKGPKGLAVIERLFTGSYVPLADAVARGAAPATVAPVLRQWAESFERSYSEAFDALRHRGTRPTMVLDAPELSLRLGRLHGARSVQLLLVDALRFDLGLRLQSSLRERLGSRIALTERLLMWSALPTVTEVQLDLLARGTLASTGDHPEDLEVPVARGRAARVARRVRAGSRELFKLDLAEASLSGSGPPEAERLDRLGDDLADSVADHLLAQPPRTLVLAFGDHGFVLPPSQGGTLAARQGGASPEEVFVPAFAWLTGETH